jgi:hypothetical protein
MSKKALEDRLADIADEAEAGEEDQTVRPIPAHVKVTRGNVRSKVLQVRLNPDEYAAIERIAERRGLPASTVAREALLKLVADEDTPNQPLVTLVALADRIKTAAVDVALASEDLEFPAYMAPSREALKQFERWELDDQLRKHMEQLVSRTIKELWVSADLGEAFRHGAALGRDTESTDEDSTCSNS